jgi:hypothetical protein
VRQGSDLFAFIYSPRWFIVCVLLHGQVGCKQTLSAQQSASDRSNKEKNFDLHVLYENDYSNVQLATYKSTGEKVIIKTFKKEHLISRPDLQQKVRLVTNRTTAALFILEMKLWA